MDVVGDRIRDLLEGDRDARDRAFRDLRGRRFEADRLVPVLAHPHISRQVKAIELLRGHRTREAVALLVPFLASPNPVVVRKTQSTLGMIGSADPEPIVMALDAGADGNHRLAVLDVLSRLEHPRGLEVLTVVADAWEPWRRHVALDCMRRYRNAPPVELIRNALHDPDTREAACEVAGKLRHASFLELLLDIWLDDPKAPTKAKYAIAKFGNLAVDALLVRAARAERTRVSDLLERCMFTGEVAVRIWELWRREEAAVRDACLAHLGSGYARQMPTGPRRAALAEHHDDASAERRRRCLRGWEQLAQAHNADAEAAVEALRTMLADPDDDIRMYAGAALRGRGRF
jgi:hypothetical protein